MKLVCSIRTPQLVCEYGKANKASHCKEWHQEWFFKDNILEIASHPIEFMRQYYRFVSAYFSILSCKLCKNSIFFFDWQEDFIHIIAIKELICYIGGLIFRIKDIFHAIFDFLDESCLNSFDDGRVIMYNFLNLKDPDGVLVIFNDVMARLSFI